MLNTKTAFSGFAVKDLAEAKDFYATVLGLEVEIGPMGLRLHLPGGAVVYVYQKDNYQSATYTVLNFSVENIDEAVDALLENGVKFEKYEGMPQDEKGIMRGLSHDMGPDIAWFTDPSGNIFSILQEE